MNQWLGVARISNMRTCSHPGCTNKAAFGLLNRWELCKIHSTCEKCLAVIALLQNKDD